MRLCCRAVCLSSLFLLASFGSWLSGGCADAPHNDAQTRAALGSLSIPLTATSSAGNTYRLAGDFRAFRATLEVYFSATAEPTLTQELPVGTYRVELVEGWSLQRVQGSTSSPVEAVLVASPGEVNITNQQTTRVVFSFRVNGEVIEVAGQLEIAITVDDAPDAQTAVRLCSLDRTVCSTNADCRPPSAGSCVTPALSTAHCVFPTLRPGTSASCGGSNIATCATNADCWGGTVCQTLAGACTNARACVLSGDPACTSNASCFIPQSNVCAP